jgi:hypothetical protein
VTISIDEQIASMATLWPDLTLVGRQASSAVWRGPLKPLFRTFQVEICYRAPLIVERLDVRRMQPQVSVLWPPLRPRQSDPEGRLPHVYYDVNGNVTLCMLDPDASDWSPSDNLAETTVPWTIEWIAAYEGWRATGLWTASGRHAEAG